MKISETVTETEKTAAALGTKRRLSNGCCMIMYVYVNVTLKRNKVVCSEVP